MPADGDWPAWQHSGYRLAGTDKVPVRPQESTPHGAGRLREAHGANQWGSSMNKQPVMRSLAVLLVLLLLSSCATTNLPPISDVGAAFEPERDELALWTAAREEEKKLREAARVYPDPLLEDYLDGIVSRLNTEGMAENPLITFRASVVEDPTLNAFAYPHGSLFIHTGLLARMENEDQLATVLGHEMTHVEERHMLRQQRAVKNRQIAAAIAAIAGTIVAAKLEHDAWRDDDWGRAATIDILADVIVGLGLQLAFVASVNGYGRDLERAADAGGLEKMRAAGYDTAEAEKVYQALADETVQPSKFETYFFGSHPNLTERISSAREWAVSHPQQAGITDPSRREEFARRIRPVIRDDAALNIELGRLDIADEELRRALGMLSNDPKTVLYLGRLQLAQAKVEKKRERRADLVAAAEDAFRETIRLDPELPEPHRELGLLAYRAKDFRIACTEFGIYLRLAPRSDENQVVRDYLVELRSDGHCPDPPK